MQRIVVMGVSGCGKSTMAVALAEALGLAMLDGDDLHLPESVAKMRAGVALDDADRWPWLDRIGQHLTHTAGGHEAGHVVACSALKRSYRERIRRWAAPVKFVFLDGSADLIAQRMAARRGHYMPPALLASQFSALERPGADEDDVLRLDITRPVGQLLSEALAVLRTGRATAPI